MATQLLELRRWLSDTRLFWVLLALNALVTVFVIAVTFTTISGDHYTYLGYAEGLARGRYSYWYFLPDYIPDTFRNPGYPIFLFLLKGIGLTETGIRLVQVVLYVATIWLLLGLAQRVEARGSWLVRNLFLLLLLPNIQLAYFAAVIFPEVLMAFLLAVYAAVALGWPLGTWRRAVTLGVLSGILFQVRPVFVLFPLVQLALDFKQLHQTTLRRGLVWGQALALLFVFGASTLPYAAWNYRHHGVFKLTSIEGGAGVMQIGFWTLRMPGYHENRYWGNRMGEELVQFADPAKVPGYIAAFNHEWDVIDAQTKSLLTTRDRRYLPLMRQQPQLFPTYSAAYTRRREQLLMQANLADIRREPGYYLKTRLYTLVRLWVTGIQRDAWAAATSPLAKLKVLYPALVSGFTFVLALVSISWAAGWGKVGHRPTWWLALALVSYFGLVHLPFAIQARYTVPVRPWLLLAVAIALAAWLNNSLLHKRALLRGSSTVA